MSNVDTGIIFACVATMIMLCMYAAGKLEVDDIFPMSKLWPGLTGSMALLDLLGYPGRART